MHIQPHIHTHHVRSSNLEAVGYDKKSHTLEVEFKEGRSYQYYEVPRSTYRGLIHADSKGHYFNENIKGQYEYARVDVEA